MSLVKGSRSPRKIRRTLLDQLLSFPNVRARCELREADRKGVFGRLDVGCPVGGPKLLAGLVSCLKNGLFDGFRRDDGRDGGPTRVRGRETRELIGEGVEVGGEVARVNR